MPHECDNNNNNNNNNNSNNDQKKKKTGIDFLDNLSTEERKLALSSAKRHWQSLTPQQKAEHLTSIYDIVRQKIREHHGMMSHADAMKEYLNVDVPQNIESAARGLEEAGYYDIASEINQRRLGIDSFVFDIIEDDPDQPTGFTVSLPSAPSREEVDSDDEDEEERSAR